MGKLGGTYVCMEGPQFSTKAESNLYRSWGADVIGMTNLQEAKLAREAEICYATVAMVTDYDCWREGHDAVTIEEIVAVLHQNAENACKVVKAAWRRCRGAHLRLRDRAQVRGADQPDAIPAAAREKLKLLFGKYSVKPSSASSSGERSEEKELMAITRCGQRRIRHASKLRRAARERCLGGAATYFSLAASFFTDVRVIAVVGEDFGAEQEAVFDPRNIDTQRHRARRGQELLLGGLVSREPERSQDASRPS